MKLSLLLCLSIFASDGVFESKLDGNRAQPYDEQLVFLRNVYNDVNVPPVDLSQKPQDFSDWGYKVSQIDAYLDGFNNIGPESLDFRLPDNKMPWGANFRPMNFNGIANRHYATMMRHWKSFQQGAFKFRTLDYSQKNPLFGKKTLRTKDDIISHLKEMQTSKKGLFGHTDLEVLSAIEKLDIYLGNYSFPGTKREILKRGLKRKGFKMNDGFCNGARAAGGNTAEPIQDVIVTNADGIQLNFFPMDIKALLSASYFYAEKYGMLGGTSRKLKFYERSNPNPPNMALFDKVIRSYLATEHIPFYIDRSNGNNLLNVTVVGFQRKIDHIKPLTGKRSARKEKIIGKLRKVAEKSPMLNDPNKSFMKAAFEERMGKIAKEAKVTVNLEILAETTVEESNKPTQARIANEGKWLKDNKVTYKLYLDKDDNILDGRLKGGQLDAVWFARGKGIDSTYLNKKGEVKGNKHIPFEVLEQLLLKSVKDYSDEPVIVDIPFDDEI